MTENKTNELNLEEMEEVKGGLGGYRRQPKEKEGFIIYQIQRGDTLHKLADRYGTTVMAIKRANPRVIRNINDITTGFYLYIPV
jgi:LysM repeat protein